ALGATYFYFLNQANVKEFAFSWAEALNFRGDSGPYVQYAYARLCGIEAKARGVGLEVDGTVDPALFDDPATYELALLLGDFDEVLDRAAAEYEPAHIARYALELATRLSRNYARLRVVGEEAATGRARLALFVAARHV